jgi:hypothetical protein
MTSSEPSTISDLNYLCSRWAIRSSIGPEARTSCWPVNKGTQQVTGIAVK